MVHQWSIALAADRAHLSSPCLSEGFTVPWIIGDGGRKREEMGTSYAYRIKSVYPKGS